MADSAPATAASPISPAFPDTHKNEPHTSSTAATLIEPPRPVMRSTDTQSSENHLIEIRPINGPGQSPNFAPDQGANLRRGLTTRMGDGLHNFVNKVEYELYMDPTGQSRRWEIWDRFRGKGRKKVGWRESARNTLFSSILNVLLIFIPFAWAAHFEKEEGTWVDDKLVLSLCFLAIIPLERLFEFGGEQMALFTGKDLGDLIIVTLNNAVEAALAIILLVKCELRILQATIIGVVLLHLLLVPGTGFLTGGMGVYQQSLHPHYTQLNLTLLSVGVLSLLIPAAFFAALDNSTTAEAALEGQNSIDHFLKMSHGLAVILLTIYCVSRIFLHNPPGDHNAFLPTDNAPKELHRHERHLLRTEPEVNSWFCTLFLFVTIAVMAVTAVMLVESIEHVREDGKITEEWFGLILLPIVSFSADGVIAVLYFFRKMLFLKPESPKALAEGRQIELSIQFVLFWMPFLVLLAWWTNRPLLLLFDMYEVAVLLGACFLVNYITADSKTNWAEGYIMIAFYIMIATCTWFYTGQGAIAAMLKGCHASLAEIEGDPLGEAVKMVEEAVSTVMEDVTKRTVAVKW